MFSVPHVILTYSHTVRGVQVAFAGTQVVGGEEQLGGAEVIFAAFRLVHRHERGLTHGGERLDLGEVARTFFEPGGAHAHADRAGGDEDDLTSRFAEGVDLCHEMRPYSTLQ